MGIFDWKHWLVILLVITLVFGTRRLRHIGSDLGGAIKGFRQSMDQHDVPPVEPRVADQSAEGARGRA